MHKDQVTRVELKEVAKLLQNFETVDHYHLPVM